MSPLVGRTDEIGMMRQRWERAHEGDGQVILLSAPAGMGKSRMTQAFRESLGVSPPTCLQLFCTPYHTNSAFYPFVRQLEFAAGFRPAATRPIESSTSSKPYLKARSRSLRKRLHCLPRCCRFHTRSAMPSSRRL